jgi:hypothetical protein
MEQPKRDIIVRLEGFLNVFVVNDYQIEQQIHRLTQLRVFHHYRHQSIGKILRKLLLRKQHFLQHAIIPLILFVLPLTHQSQKRHNSRTQDVLFFHFVSVFDYPFLVLFQYGKSCSDCIRKLNFEVVIFVEFTEDPENVRKDQLILSLPGATRSHVPDQYVYFFVV